MSRALSKLEDFLALSEAIAEAAKAETWEETARLGEERATLLAELPTDLNASLTVAERTRGRAIIERCLQLDEQTRELVDERKHALNILLREPILTL